MSCSEKFYKQCFAWRNTILTSITITLFAFVVFLFLGYQDWHLFIKTAVVLGCATCLCWWIWVMKKIRDIAEWWLDLHHKLDTAQNLLVETKQDIKTIKQSYKQENSLFG